MRGDGRVETVTGDEHTVPQQATAMGMQTCNLKNPSELGFADLSAIDRICPNHFDDLLSDTTIFSLLYGYAILPIGAIA